MLLLKRICLACILATAGCTTAMAASGAAHYRRCLGIASANPNAALADATAWARSGGAQAAEHCAAMALVGLKRYGEAATRLEALARGGLPNASLRATLFDQAGNAWILAGDGARASGSFQAALTLSASDPDLFADLARAQAMQKDWRSVVSDLNAALALDGRRPDLLVLRASAYRALQQFGPAKADLDAALALKPGDNDALLERGLLRRQLGDMGGARADFTFALRGGGATAAEARDNLDALNAR